MSNALPRSRGGERGTQTRALGASRKKEQRTGKKDARREEGRRGIETHAERKKREKQSTSNEGGGGGGGRRHHATSPFPSKSGLRPKVRERLHNCIPALRSRGSLPRRTAAPAAAAVLVLVFRGFMQRRKRERDGARDFTGDDTRMDNGVIDGPP